MKFAVFVSVLGLFILTACGPQVYYDQRVSLYQKVMEQCSSGDRFECQDKYDNMILSSYEGPAAEAEQEIPF